MDSACLAVEHLQWLHFRSKLLPLVVPVSNVPLIESRIGSSGRRPALQSANRHRTTVPGHGAPCL